MGIKDIKEGKLLYHLTKLDNLDSILEKGLLSRKDILERGLGFEDVADKEIITKRRNLKLDSYIPFHFHPYSSFDVAVKKTYSSQEFIYICISRNSARRKGFKILKEHPLSVSECILLDYDKGFGEIDWETMQTYGTENEYTKNVKMAECLIDDKLDACDFHSIVVKNKDIKAMVEAKLKKNNIVERPPYVNVQSWF